MSGSYERAATSGGEVMRIGIISLMAVELSQTFIDHEDPRSKKEKAKQAKKVLAKVAKNLDLLGVFKDNQSIKIPKSKDKKDRKDVWLTKEGRLMLPLNDPEKNKPSESNNYRQASDIEYVLLFNRVRNSIGDILYSSLPEDEVRPQFDNK